MSLCLAEDPDLVMTAVQQKVREVVVMGGVVFPPALCTENELFTAKGIEFNFYFDPDVSALPTSSVSSTRTTP
eukprot:753852-Hanusia_phi.AAC.3